MLSHIPINMGYSSTYTLCYGLRLDAGRIYLYPLPCTYRMFWALKVSVASALEYTHHASQRSHQAGHINRRPATARQQETISVQPKASTRLQRHSAVPFIGNTKAAMGHNRHAI